MSFLDLNIDDEYRSLLSDVVNDFYYPVLSQAVLYKRAVGFFSSSALLEITEGLDGLIRNNGCIELIASPKLTEKDIEAIRDGYSRRDEILTECLLRELRDPQGKFEEARLNLLSNLIAAKRLTIKIAFLEHNKQVGMFHEKLGLMYDAQGNILAFSGSMNETSTAFSHNYESFDVFKSWTADESRVMKKQAAFNAMWNDYEPSIVVREFPSVAMEIVDRYKQSAILDLSSYNKSFLDDTIDSRNLEDILISDSYPRIPQAIHLRDYQLEAINTWEQNGYRGIFDMATGTGKTITALAALERLSERLSKKLAVVVVCPYQHLVDQWKKTIEEFNMKPIVCYSTSSQKNWRERVKDAVRSYSIGAIDHFCIVTTNATFSLDFLQSQIVKVKNNALLVVDEAHNFGAEKLQHALLPHIGFRLALSATLDRHGDEEGTQQLYDYFGKKCIEYTLKDAITNNMLTPYYYYPIPVVLTQNELDDYIEISQEISSSIAKGGAKDKRISEYTKLLLIKRARIVAGAENKIAELVREIEPFKNETHILIYCGATTLRDVEYSESHPPADEIRQIDAVKHALDDMGMRIHQFTSKESSSSREIIKAEFEEGKHLQALVAIRCLDEGVDIPSIKTAFILASSTNPKEYVQRRGRVLRLASNKSHANIFDFITLPFPLEDVRKFSPDTIRATRSLAIREIERMRDFAEISENPSTGDSLIYKMVDAFGIAPGDYEETA